MKKAVNRLLVVTRLSSVKLSIFALLLILYPISTPSITLNQTKEFYTQHSLWLSLGLQAILITLLIIARRKAKKDLKASQNQLHKILDLMPHLIFAKNRRGQLLLANRAVARFSGISVNKLIGSNHLRLFEKDEEERLGEEDGLGEERLTDARGIEHTFQIARIPFEDPVSRDAAILTVAVDITEQRLLANKLTYYATHDQLTNLINRREFESRLQRVLHTAATEHTENALCYLDLDQFKVINDTAGHSAGDQLLIQLAQVMQVKVRKRDTLSRLGGDEFGILLEHCTLNQARRIAIDIQKVVNDFVFIWEGKNFRVSASIGVVPITSNYDRIAEVLQAADHACYLAKESGRNRIHIHNPDDTEYTRRHGEMQWVARINHALDENRFVLYAQKIVSVNGNDDGLHYEILLRMRDEDGLIITPGAFLPAAERFGLVTKLDYWTIRTVMNWLARHPAHVKALKLCSINLSGHSLSDTRFLEFIINQVNEYNLDATKFCFEITETAAIFNLSAASRFIRTLIGYGFRFSLDDFGTGLSSFAYLRSLPVHYLKIDGVFVCDIATNEVDLAMVKSINEIGHVMQKKTIAEFVEDEDVFNKLKHLGVDYAQGYYFGQPQPLEHLVQ